MTDRHLNLPARAPGPILLRFSQPGYHIWMIGGSASRASRSPQTPMRSIGHTPDQDPPSTPTTQGQHGEYGDALSDVLEDQARRSERRRTGPIWKARRKMNPIVPLSLAVFSFWLWVFPPEVLEPVPPPPVTPVVTEAGLRIEMYVQSALIQRYLEENGRLPSDLREVGDGPTGLQYVAISDTNFRLSGLSGGVSVSYTSTTPLADLLANAKEVVSGLAGGRG